MATVYGAWSRGWTPSGSSVSKKYRARLDYEVVSESLTQYVVNVTVYVNLNSSVTTDDNLFYGESYATDFSAITGTCKTKYQGSLTVLCVGTRTYTYNKGNTPQTKSLVGTVRSSAGSWDGTRSVATEGITIPAISYNISFDANGGSGAPSSLSQIINGSITIPESIPAKPDYDFVGWTDGTGTYSPGDTYSAVANTQMTAIWHQSYVQPQINNIRAYRVVNGANGDSPPPANDGVKVFFDCDYVPAIQNGSAPVMTLSFSHDSSTTTPITGESKIYGYSADNHLPATNTEKVTVTINITDYLGNAYSYNYSTYVSSENYIWDAYKDASGDEGYQSFAIGGQARDLTNSLPTQMSPNGNFDIYMDVMFATMIGEVKQYAGNTIPNGWILCDGSELLKTDHPLLFGAIGDLWGEASDSLHFKLPNFSGKVPIGYDSNDTDFSNVGITGGEKEHTLSVNEIPAHAHGWGVSNTHKSGTAGTNFTHAGAGGAAAWWTSERGGSAAHNNLQPYAVVKYIICTGK